MTILSPEALLTWDSVRRLEDHTDIGPGGVTRLLIEVNFREHVYRCNLLRSAGFLPDERCRGTFAHQATQLAAEVEQLKVTCLATIGVRRKPRKITCPGCGEVL